MAEYLLDTNAVSDLVREPLGRTRQKAERTGPERLATSIIVVGELRFGYLRSGNDRLKHAVEGVLANLSILPFETPADWRYAELRAELERLGTPIGANDMLIAAHALALECTLVTANEREFRRVPGLRVENWRS